MKHSVKDMYANVNKKKKFYIKYNKMSPNISINTMLNAEGAQNHHHHHYSYDEQTNQDDNLHSENVVERIVHHLNVLAEMIGLMIHN